jgi:hypothetical protein
VEIEDICEEDCPWIMGAWGFGKPVGRFGVCAGLREVKQGLSRS